MIERALTPRLLEALSDTPVVTLVGGRQTGKSTLVTGLAKHGHLAEYVSLDDPTELAGARNDPVAFVDRFAGPVIVDEVQRAPELLLPIKASVDRDRRPGRFLLTGSANVLFVPAIAEALAGRMEVLTLWPFSAAEIDGRSGGGIVDLLFAGDLRPPTAELSTEELVSRLLAGGYPEAVARKNDERRRQWFSSYLNTILDRDVRTMADIARLEQLPALLTAIALRGRGPLNKSGLSQDLGIPNSSIDRYVTLLTRVFLARLFPAWHNRLGPRLVKAPKLLVSDSGLLCRLLRFDRKRVLEDSAARGLALESYVGMELVKAVDVAGGGSDVMHYRTTKGTEVDFVVEAADGRVVGIEVKGASSVDARDFRRFERLEQTLGERFVRGIVLYSGSRPVPFGDRLEAWPVGLL
ncbi:MAG TPA: ATP-binding protein [Solirubrobacterales bacterium]